MYPRARARTHTHTHTAQQNTRMQTYKQYTIYNLSLSLSLCIYLSCTVTHRIWRRPPMLHSRSWLNYFGKFGDNFLKISGTTISATCLASLIFFLGQLYNASRTLSQRQIMRPHKFEKKKSTCVIWKFLMSEDCKNNNKVNFILKTVSQLATVSKWLLGTKLTPLRHPSHSFHPSLTCVAFSEYTHLHKSLYRFCLLAPVNYHTNYVSFGQCR